MIPTKISLADFAKSQGIDIVGFEMSAGETNELIKSIESSLSIPPAFSPDEDLVVFGSIARNECVAGSDIDWTLLVDGQANPNHSKLENNIRKKLKKDGFKDPGTSGMFGHISFSHELIHNIGGQSDTNHNLSKRILLLLESLRLSLNGSSSNSGAYDRIIRGILSQYIEHDSGLNSNRPAIPRYLLNDVVRFWRTMCVDFAYKQKEEEGEKWALRNIKLRISRKMLFVKGMLMCLSHHGEKQDKPTVIKDLGLMVRITPIELLINLQDHFNLKTDDIVDVVKCYNEFLLKLHNKETRAKLSSMNMKDIYEEGSFIDLRDTADKLQKALDNIFILHTSPLTKLTSQYAIF